jgi:hypothetical protein
LSDTSLFETDGEYEKIVQGDPDGVPSVFEEGSCVWSPQNQVFAHAGNPCLALGRVDEDEWNFLVAYPLSVFVGFGIALAILRKIPK